MKTAYSIPDKAVPYILFQRTAYLRYTNSLLYKALRKVSPMPLYKPVVYLESFFRGGAIKDLYMDDMAHEYAVIKSALPEECRSVLDIGCGIAGINIFIQQHYNGKDLKFYLLDKSAVEDNVFYLFNARGAFYNSLDLARDTLVSSGIKKENIDLLEANEKNEINVPHSLDLIISLISWGFHYPITTYLDRVYELLSDKGRLIVDVRKETDGLSLLKSRFNHVQIIEETTTRQRIVCSK